jgi:hypothetical protein
MATRERPRNVFAEWAPEPPTEAELPLNEEWLDEESPSDPWIGRLETPATPREGSPRYWVRVELAATDNGEGADKNGASVQERAAAMAVLHPHVGSVRPEAPALTGNVISDIRNICGFSTQLLASATRQNEQTIRAWRDDPETIPPDVLTFLNALRAIGATLVGGLGPRGVEKWLRQGPDAPMDILLEGRLDEVVARAKEYEGSIAT